MKRRVLFLFLLILYLLVACSMLSAKIEEEMATLVQVEKRTSSSPTGQTMTLNIRAVFTDSEGDHLYEVREGDGWDSGLRSYDVPGFGIDFMKGVVSVYGSRDYSFIKSASRQPQNGELAIIVEEFATGQDSYLYYYNNGVPTQWELPQYLTVIARSDNALLTDNSEGTFPFLPHTAKTLTVTTDMADRVFSLSEVCMFLKELPKVTLAFTLLGMGFLLLLLFPLFSADRKLLYGNMTGVIAIMVFFGLELSKIDLPASLLPSTSILDLEYYKNEMRLIANELECMGESSFNVLGLMKDVQQNCVCIFAAGILLVGVIVVIEVVILWKKSKADQIH